MKFVEPIRDVQKIEEIKTILKRDNYRNYMIFVISLYSGLRISDALSLRVKDVKGKTHIEIKEGKTDKYKKFIIPSRLKGELEEYVVAMDDEEYLFASRNSPEPLKRVRAWKIISEAAKKAGLSNIGSHSMRKSFGYHMYKQTKDIALLQKIFNHSSPSITLRYIGIEQDTIDEQMRDFDFI